MTDNSGSNSNVRAVESIRQSHTDESQTNTQIPPSTKIFYSSRAPRNWKRRLFPYVRRNSFRNIFTNLETSLSHFVQLESVSILSKFLFGKETNFMEENVRRLMLFIPARQSVQFVEYSKCQIRDFFLQFSRFSNRVEYLVRVLVQDLASLGSAKYRKRVYNRRRYTNVQSRATEMYVCVCCRKLSKRFY